MLLFWSRNLDSPRAEQVATGQRHLLSHRHHGLCPAKVISPCLSVARGLQTYTTGAWISCAGTYGKAGLDSFPYLLQAKSDT